MTFAALAYIKANTGNGEAPPARRTLKQEQPMTSKKQNLGRMRETVQIALIYGTFPPTRKQIFIRWNSAKRRGEIPKRWSFAKHGRIERVYVGWAILAGA